MIKTLVAGPNGKMGKAMIQLAQGHPMITIVGGIGHGFLPFDLC